MALDVDFLGLYEAMRRMGAEPTDFQIGGERDPLEPIDIELEKGIELPDLNEVETANGLLSYQGRQILLYIQDHTGRIHDALNDGTQGNRFHVANCSTLRRMRAQGRYERYVVTNNLNGRFYITGTDWHTGQERDGETELQVCQNCISSLNYKGCGSGRDGRREIARTFNIAEFFETYSSFFPHLPSRRSGDDAGEGYTPDWAQVSARVKAEKDFTCERCGVNLREHKGLLHVHHRSGVKSDNSRGNLVALCALCHRDQPHHGHLFIKHKNTQKINRLRRSQGVLQQTSWHKVFDYCDPGVVGLLDACQKQGAAPPEVGLDVQGQDDAIVANLELAWPKAKVGVAIAEEDLERARSVGWRVWTMIGALEDTNGFVSATRREHDPPKRPDSRR